MKKDKTDFISAENEGKYVISEEDLEDVVDIDLRSISPGQMSSMEIEESSIIDNMVSGGIEEDNISDYNADTEDGDDISYTIGIDDDIVKNVLSGSEKRSRDLAQETTKKIAKYLLIGSCFLGVLCYSAIILPDAMVYKEIEEHGSVFHYDDPETFLEEMGNLFDTPVEVSEEVIIPTAYTNFVDVRGPAFQPGVEIPFFVEHNDGSNIVEDVLSKCLGKVIAGYTQSIPPSLTQSLTTFDIESNPAQTYVTVNLSGQGGVMNAKEKALIPKGAEIGLGAVFVPYTNFYFAGENLFSLENPARLFTMIRNPVDRIASEYYEFINNQPISDQVMSFDQFIDSEHYQKNWFTGFVTGVLDKPVTESYLSLAKEILRTKYIIGTHDDIYGSIELFEDYFFWRSEGSHTKRACQKKSMRGEFIRNFAIYHKVGHKIRVNSTLYQHIVDMNRLDMELFWHGVEIHRKQRSWIPILDHTLRL